VTKIFKMWEHRAWGDKIGWLQAEKPVAKISGFLSRRPVDGDILFADTGEFPGAKSIFLLGNVEYMADPHDMFFADALYLNTFESEEEMASVERRWRCE